MQYPECPNLVRGAPLCKCSYLTEHTKGRISKIVPANCEKICAKYGPYKGKETGFEKDLFISKILECRSGSPTFQSGVEGFQNFETVLKAKKEWTSSKSSWEKAGSFFKSVSSRGLVASSLHLAGINSTAGARVSEEIYLQRKVSCLGDEKKHIPKCPMVFQNEKGMFCNACSCGDKSIARLDFDSAQDYTKLHFPELKCPLKRKGFSNYQPVEYAGSGPRILHYHLYNDGNIGLCNLLMSIECAIIIAKLTSRKIIFYGTKKIFNSTRGLSFFDFFDVDYDYSTSELPVSEDITSFGFSFDDLVINNGQDSDVEFKNGRKNEINLKDFDHIAEIRTNSNMTLACYSYLFFIPVERGEIFQFLKEVIRPKIKYSAAAEVLSKEYGKFNSIHFRRGDSVGYTTLDRSIDSVLPVIKNNFPEDQLLLIHSDEQDSNYFLALEKQYSRTRHVDKDILMSFNDPAEAGLVSLLVAAKSLKFSGTMKSTFTSIIQRYRLYSGLVENFNYIYPSLPEMKMNPDGSFYEESFGKNSWNRINSGQLKSSLFWYREHPECWAQKAIRQEVQIFPCFLVPEELQHVIQLADSVKSDVSLQWQKRDRKTVQFSRDEILGGMVRRACKILNYDYENLEDSVQIFVQEVGGGVELHVDSLFMDGQGMRISSVLFYLNDDYKGCSLNFPNLNISISPKAGTMVAYPTLNEYREQDKKFAHETTKITEGRKYMCYISLKERPLC